MYISYKSQFPLYKMLELKSYILVFLLFFPIVESMRFDMLTGNSKCITEEVRLNAMTVGKYSVVNPNQGVPLPSDLKISVRVASPLGTYYHYTNQVESGNFAFTAAEEGDFMACFWTGDHKPPVMLSIDFEWESGLAAKDWSKVINKGKVEMMEFEIKKLFDVVASIHDEMFYLREREEEMQTLNIATNSKMAKFSFFSIVLCLAVAGIQIWYLKNFFESKKLI